MPFTPKMFIAPTFAHFPNGIPAAVGFPQMVIFPFFRFTTIVADKTSPFKTCLKRLGLKSAATLAAQDPSQQTEFDVAYFMLSLMIGFTAGLSAGFAMGLDKFAKIDPTDPKLLLALVAAGYAGTDFIENVFTNLIPKIGTPPQLRAAGAASHPANRGPFKRNLKSVPLSSREGETPSYVQTVDNADLSAALKVVAPKVNTNIWVPALSASFLKFDLTTDRRVAAAIGQFLVEAGDSFQELAEDLDYTSARVSFRLLRMPSLLFEDQKPSRIEFTPIN